jgi:predicted dehydrogenase
MKTIAKPRVLLIGHGHLGKWHAEKAANSSEITFVGIAEGNEQVRERLKMVYPKLKIVADYHEVIDEIDAALVVTPTSVHYKITKELLNAGKHVFCEKPICTDYKEAVELEKLAKDKELLLQVGHSERFHKIFDREEVSYINDFLKPPFIFEAKRVAPFKGRATDVDVVSDVMIHDLDLLLYLTPNRPYKIEASGFKMRTNAYDHVMAVMSYKDGSRAVIEASRNAVEEIRSVKIAHKTGCLELNLLKNTVRAAKASADGSESQPFVTEWTYDKRDHLYMEQKAFYRAMIEGTPLPVTAKDGANAVELISHILKSLDEGKEIIIG